MVDTKISALADGVTSTATDRIPVAISPFGPTDNRYITPGYIQTLNLSGSSSLQMLFNNAGAFGGMSGTSWDNTNRSLTLTGATVTASHPVLELSQTWNNAAVAFTAINLNVTNTASLSSSPLINLQVGGVNQFRVDRLGSITNAGNITTGSVFMGLGVTNSSSLTFGTAADVVLGRNAAASLRMGSSDAAAPVAQTLGVQSVVAGTTNTAGVNWTLKGSTSTGSGIAGDIILQTGGTGAGATAQNAFVTALTIKGATQNALFNSQAVLKGYTVATLPTGVEGGMVYVTDQLTAPPAKGATFTGGGAVKCPAFFNGTAWVSP